eukprot:3498569-Pleurochrysis_carterae.AAC.1
MCWAGGRDCVVQEGENVLGKRERLCCAGGRECGFRECREGGAILVKTMAKRLASEGSCAEADAPSRKRSLQVAKTYTDALDHNLLVRLTQV